MLAKHIIRSRIHAPTCQATGSFSFAFTLPGQPLSLDSQTKMSPFSFFILCRIYHTWFCLILGTGNKRRLINVKKVASWGNDFCNVLPALHTFTGCDTISAFVRKGKTTHLLISLVALIFSVSWKIFWHATSHVEHFVCMLYDRYSTTTIINLWTFASSKVCRQIHPKTRKGTLNLQWSWFQPSTTTYHHAEGEIITNPSSRHSFS